MFIVLKQITSNKLASINIQIITLKATDTHSIKTAATMLIASIRTEFGVRKSLTLLKVANNGPTSRYTAPFDSQMNAQVQPTLAA